MRDRKFGGVVAFVVALLVSVDLCIALWGIPTFLFVEPTAGDRVLVWVLLCVGPLSGWILATAHGQLLSALPMFGWATIYCVVPLVVAVVRRSTVALALLALLWFACGYLFTIAIWI